MTSCGRSSIHLPKTDFFFQLFFLLLLLRVCRTHQLNEEANETLLFPPSLQKTDNLICFQRKIDRSMTQKSLHFVSETYLLKEKLLFIIITFLTFSPSQISHIKSADWITEKIIKIYLTNIFYFKIIMLTLQSNVANNFKPFSFLQFCSI